MSESKRRSLGSVSDVTTPTAATAPVNPAETASSTNDCPERLGESMERNSTAISTPDKKAKKKYLTWSMLYVCISKIFL